MPCKSHFESFRHLLLYEGLLVPAQWPYTTLHLTYSVLSSLQFQKQYIEKGKEGGKQAAYALRNAILRECYDYAGQFEVITRYIANLSGLAMATRSSGTIENESTFKDFTLGFTQGLASFDFIDVGPGKERADTKIKGEARP